jgi:ribosome recycling factor
MYDFSELKKQLEGTKDWLKQEYAGVRTGRATPALLDGIRVESYGSKMALNQVATVTVEDARTLRISPWDHSQVKIIEKAIQDSDLGVTAGSDEKGVRVHFPDLTAERREQLKKVVRAKLEDARVRLRHARDDTWNAIQKAEKDSTMSEDEKFRSKDEMQKLIDSGNKDLEEMAKRKEEEITS